MKTLFRNVNKAGVIMILFAAGLIVTQSAFKEANKEDHVFAKQEDGVWINIDDVELDATEPYVSGTYRCDGTTNKCTIVAPVAPLTGSNPSGATPGNYIVNP